MPVLVALLCLARGGYPQDNALAAKVKSIVTTNKIRLSEAGIRIVSVRTGETLLDSFGGKLFVPASNAKLVTTAAALHLLGREFRFQTRLYTRGRVKDGILHGDLVVVGGGDPGISERLPDGDSCFLFKEWTGRLRALGIREVRGSLIGDVSAFDSEYLHPSWPEDQRGNWYCAPVSALVLNDNCVDVTVAPGPEAGARAEVTLAPDIGYTFVGNHCTTTASKARHLYGFLGRAGPKGLTLRGKFWANGPATTTCVPVEDPSQFFLKAMAATLARQGVEISEGVTVAHRPVKMGKDSILVATHESALSRAVAVANKRSHNLYAELMLKTLGWKFAGRGSFDSGGAVAKTFLAGVSSSAAECRIADGSGLSREARLSAAAITDLLRWIAAQPETDVFAASLPVSGTDGTLRHRLRSESCRGRVKAKTGTLKAACALSGYIRMPRDTLAFAILMNSTRAPLGRMRKAQDAICRAVIDSAAPPAGTSSAD